MSRLPRWAPFTRKDMTNRQGDVYLSRWHLLRVGGWALMLHCMHRPDEDRCMHDHPWWFITLVLRGGYAEQVAAPPAKVPLRWRLAGRFTVTHDGRCVFERHNRPGMLLYRRATHTHRVAGLPRGKCYTLVLRGPVARTWGFRNALGQWRPWDAFVDWAGSVLWCKEDA